VHHPLIDGDLPTPQAISSMHAEAGTIVNFRTASVDSDFRPVTDPRVKREIRELQRGETIYMWQHGVDRDGNPDRPRAWKLYDPHKLPMVYQYQYHDSEGVNGLLGNVILGGRAMVALLNAGVSVRQRVSLLTIVVGHSMPADIGIISAPVAWCYHITKPSMVAQHWRRPLTRASEKPQRAFLAWYLRRPFAGAAGLGVLSVLQKLIRWDPGIDIC
jgi:hypothetical protein